MNATLTLRQVMGFVGDVAIITHNKEQSVFALQMATFPDGNSGAVDVYEQNVKRILGRE